MTDERSDAVSRRAALKRLGAVASGAYFAGVFRNESADIIVGARAVHR